MATITIILDTRTKNKKGESPLKICVANGAGDKALAGVGLALNAEQWNKANQCAIGRHNNALNEELESILYEWRNCAKQLPAHTMTALELKNAILAKLQPGKKILGSFFNAFNAFIDRKKGRTQVLYKETQHRIEQFAPKAEALRLEDITVRWLEHFGDFLALTAPSVNSRNIHFRNIRAVFNYALEEGLAEVYPFRKFKIKNTETTKRSLSLDDLRFIFNYKGEKHAQKYIDAFKLIFLLVGINVKDLCATHQIINGRIDYIRSKTHKLYSIKVEPEALALLAQFTDEQGNICIAPNYANYKDYAQKLNKALQRIGEVKRVGLGGRKIFKPLYPQLTTYWARHSWATVAAELDIPNEVIAAALGHTYGNRTTAIYINFNAKKIDEANRRVIDYVLYNKRAKI